MGDKDRVLLQLYRLGKARDRNLLKEFLMWAGVKNFAQATAGQIRTFYEDCVNDRAAV